MRYILNFEVLFAIVDIIVKKWKSLAMYIESMPTNEILSISNIMIKVSYRMLKRK